MTCWGRWEGVDPVEWLNNMNKDVLSNHASRAVAYSMAIDELDGTPTRETSEVYIVVDKKRVEKPGEAILLRDLGGEGWLQSFIVQRLPTRSNDLFLLDGSSS